MDWKPFISVIIPAYNVAPYIEEAIDSVKHQTFKDWELIIIDDGSTDDTLSIAQHKTEMLRAEKVKVIHQPNSGLSASRNQGIRYARGKYVCFLDADDTISSDALEKLVYVARNNDLDMMLFSSEVFADKQHRIGNEQVTSNRIREYEHYCDRLVKDFTIMTGARYLTYMINNNHFIPTAQYSIYKHTLLGDNPFIKGILFEDNPFTVDILLRAHKVGVSNEKLYRHRIRSGSIMHDTNPDYKERFVSRFMISESIRSQLSNVNNIETIDSLSVLYQQFITLSFDDYSHLINDCKGIMPDISFSNAETQVLYNAFFSSKLNYFMKESEIHDLRSKLDAVHNSLSFRLGSTLITLPRFVKRLLSKQCMYQK